MEVNMSSMVSSGVDNVSTKGGFSRRPLFKKRLTLSDVGKLSRVVIPKRDAITHFSEISLTAVAFADAGVASHVPIHFFDTEMGFWSFRFQYWRSSQSFVFTRGWSKFVKAKQLKANDAIAFYLCEVPRGDNMVQRFFMIDTIKVEDRGGSSSTSVTEVAHHNVGSVIEGADHHVELKPELRLDALKKLKEEMMEVDPPSNVERKGFRLFGVQIN